MLTLLQRIFTYVCPSSPLTQLRRAGNPKAMFGGMVAAAILLPGTLAAASTYYVSSQNGNDGWSGLLASPNSSQSDGPFRTLSRAQGAMESSSIKTATLRAGTYSIASSMQLNSVDSGETWIAYSGESPILDGGGSGVVALFANSITFEGLTFQNLGAGGLVFHGSSSHTIRWNSFLNCYAGCMTSSVSNSIIDSDTINGETGGAGGYSAIQFWSGSSNNQITHNLIENAAGGVNIGTGPYDPPANNNIVDRNIFENIGSSSVDTAAIYMVDISHSVVGNQITNNIINGVGGTNYLSNITKGIYLDDNMSNVLISGNICAGCGAFAWQIHAGDHNTIVNNIFDLGSQPGGPTNENGGAAIGTLLGLYQTNPSGSDWGMRQNVFQRNIVYISGTIPYDLYQVNTVSSDEPLQSSGNLYYSASGGPIPNSSIYPAYNFIIDSNPVYANPQFAQESAGNYSMPASSPAYTAIGFQPLATNQGPVSGGPSVPSASGTLTGVGTSANNTGNLTAAGPTDWIHWGVTLTRKNGVNAQISSDSVVGSVPTYVYNNDPRALTWFDGTPITSGTGNDGIYLYGSGNGFSFTAPASTSTHTLTVYVGGWASGGTLTAHLSDGSAANFVDSTSAVSGQYDRTYTLTYSAASAGQQLTVSWVQNSGWGNVTLNGAALQ